MRQPAPCPRTLCDSDRELLRWTLRRLPDLYRLLDREYTQVSRAASGPRVSGTPEPSLLIRMDVDAVQRAIARLLATLGRRVQQLTAPQLPDYDLAALAASSACARVVPPMCELLDRQVDGLMVVDPGGELINRLFALQHRARGMLNLRGERVRVPGVCPTCDARGAMTRWGVDPHLLEGVTCTNCGQTHLADDDLVRSMRKRAGRLEEPTT